jgi:hypothetical protein
MKEFEMRRILLAAVLIVFLSGAFPSGQPAYARLPKIPRGFGLSTETVIAGCTYSLWLTLYEFTKGAGTLAIQLESPCLSGLWEVWREVGRNEFNLNGSLKSAVLKATVLDEASGAPVVVTDLRFKSVGHQPADYFNPALVTGAVQFPELGLTFTFDQDPSGGIWYGT